MSEPRQKIYSPRQIEHDKSNPIPMVYGMYCNWREDEYRLWHTDCGDIHEFFADTPEENSYRFCPYCGRVLISHRYSMMDENLP